MFGNCAGKSRKCGRSGNVGGMVGLGRVRVGLGSVGGLGNVGGMVGLGRVVGLKMYG
jgi:hypothetical protein